MSFFDWYRGLWPNESGDTELSVATTEVQLGLKLPSLLRAFYRHASLREANDIHVEPLERLSVDHGVLVFAREQQACWQWGVPRAALAEGDPQLMSNIDGRWKLDGCRLEDFLTLAAQLARLYWPPTANIEVDVGRLPSGWREIVSGSKSLSLDRGTLFTNDVGVYSRVDGVLGACDSQTLKAVALELGVGEGFAISHGGANFEDV